MRLRVRLVAALLGLIAWAATAAADDWPTQPITMIAPFGAGGPTDVVGRLIAERMSSTLGQQVVVENVTGAGGMTGAARVAQAPPDGYEILLGTVGTQVYNQTLFKHPLYNARSDFASVGLIAEQPLVLITRPDLPVDALPEFVSYLKANAGDMAFGSGGSGSATHLGCVLLNAALKVRVQHIPYRGSAFAMQDLTGGRLDYLCDSVTTAMPQIQAHAVKAIAVLARNRSPVLPGVPTADEQGLRGVEATNWVGLFVPKGTPPAIIRRLNEATIAAMNTASLIDRARAIGTDLVSPERRSPEYLDRFVVSEIEKWAEPIRASGVSVD
jgi:tripartite-type tricarboxylate transporter receptor subunit TctC